MDRLPTRLEDGSATFQKTVLSSMSLLIGSTSLLISLKVLKSEDLQIDNYLIKIVKREKSQFPIDILTSAVLSTTFGIGQVVISLMFFFGDVGWRSWCWSHFAFFLSNTLSLFQTEYYFKIDDVHDLNQNKHQSFHTILIINTGFSLISVLHSLLVLNLQRKYSSEVYHSRS